MNKNFNNRLHDKHIDRLEEKIEELTKDFILESNNLSNLLCSLQQTINERILPLGKKHDVALYSEDGTNGIVKDVIMLKDNYNENNNILEKHIKSHWQFATLIVSIAAIIASIITRII